MTVMSNFRLEVETSGYTTWFTAGCAIRIALQQHWQTWKLHHYDVIEDVITRKV